MDLKYQKIWNLALPYLEKGKMKNFVVHTEGVVESMKMILAKEKADKDILIASAILHDVGWAHVPAKLQKKDSWKNKPKLREAMELHLKYSEPIIRKILNELKYQKKDINHIVDIVKDHKYKNPVKKEKRFLIDADNLSDILKDQFWSDIKVYQVNSAEHFELRKLNKFYTKTAQNIFDRELKKRKKELNSI